MEFIKKKKLVSCFLILYFAVASLCCDTLDSNSFDIVLNKKTPDYFRFVDSQDKEIGTEGLTFSIPDPSNLQSTASVSVVYDIRSGSTLTLHRTTERTIENVATGYMMNGADNENAGLNYDLAYKATDIEGKSMTLNIPDSLEPNERNKQINLQAYEVVIYSPTNGNSSAGRVDFTFIMNPPQWDDGGISYMDDVYTGYLTLKLTGP